MRNLVLLFAVVCGLVIIWTVGNYGYASADEPSAQLNIAFLFGVIALAGLFGHAVSIRLWSRNKFWSICVGLTCGAALVLNLSNSLGALATRNSRTSAENASRIASVRDDRAELARLQKALDQVGPYIPTDQAAVDAAQRAADAATTAKERECGNGDPRQRGRFCREKEDAERAAADALAKATAAKALTDRALRLEGAMQPIQQRLRAAGPVMATNVQGTAIAKLFRRPDDEAEFAATLQQFALAAVVEALIVLAMIAYELLGSDGKASAVRWAKLKAWWSSRRQTTMTAGATSQPITREPLKLVSSQPSASAARTARSAEGAIPKILTAALEPASASRIELAAVYRRYAAECAAAGGPAVTAQQFAEPLASFCKGAGIRTKTEGDLVFLLNVRLAMANQGELQATM
jgi:hypothetical protein